MGGHAFFFAVGSIGLSRRGGRKPSTLLGAMRHNRRTIVGHVGIDPSRSHLNVVLAGAGTPEDVVARAEALCREAGVDLQNQRRDYVQGVELLFSLPPTTDIDTVVYFGACLAWVRGRFGDVVLAADVHHDEAAPHCHVVVLPLVDGRLRGSKLITRPRLAELWTAFAREVAQPHGLKAPPRRMSPAARAGTAAAVLEHVAAAHPDLLKSVIWPLVRASIQRDPGAYAVALGLDVQRAPRRQRTMAEIFTSAGKGGREERCARPIGLCSNSLAWGTSAASRVASVPARNLSCVGFGPEPALSCVSEGGC